MAEARGCLDTSGVRVLRDLVARLTDLGYQESAVTRVLELNEIHDLRDGFSPRTLSAAQQDSPLAHLCAFWFLGHLREPSILEDLMGEGTLEALHALRLVEPTPQGVRAQAHLFPCVGHYIFTDLMAYRGEEREQVYWLGGDSVALARCAPRRRVGRALDLCTGSGVHAVLAAAHADESWGVDINPRALEYGRINALVNGHADTSHFTLGDLYAPVSGAFNLITANPPFVPTPRKDLAFFRPGGETGEEITARIVSGLPERLEPGGTMALVSQCPVIRGSHVLDRVADWLGGERGWGLAYLRMGSADRDQTIAGHVKTRNQFRAELGTQEGEKAYRQEFETWLECYDRNGIEAVELAIIFVRRLSADHPGWRALADTTLPKVCLSPHVEGWLEAQEAYHRGVSDWQWRPAWLGTNRLMRDVRSGEGFVFTEPAAWRGQGRELEPGHAFLLGLADGRRTAEELLHAYAGHSGQEAQALRGEVSRRLAELARELLVH